VLTRGEVLVRFARPERLLETAARARAEALLAPDERARIARFHFERDRLLHLAARALLRRSLSSCAPVAPEAWRFEAEASGRPFVASPEAPLRFSVSHTRGLAAVAVAVEADVGVDVEEIADEVPREVVEVSLAPIERAALAGTAPTERAGAFTALWTLKEAYAKARGLGLGLPFEGFAVALGPARLVDVPDAEDWHVASLAPTEHHRAALCALKHCGAAPRVRVEVED
jgi:4'-phosphopantetheinyl transferase